MCCVKRAVTATALAVVLTGSARAGQIAAHIHAALEMRNSLTPARQSLVNSNLAAHLAGAQGLDFTKKLEPILAVAATTAKRIKPIIENVRKRITDLAKRYGGEIRRVRGDVLKEYKKQKAKMENRYDGTEKMEKVEQLQEQFKKDASQREEKIRQQFSEAMSKVLAPAEKSLGTIENWAVRQLADVGITKMPSLLTKIFRAGKAQLSVGFAKNLANVREFGLGGAIPIEMRAGLNALHYESIDDSEVDGKKLKEQLESMRDLAGGWDMFTTSFVLGMGDNCTAGVAWQKMYGVRDVGLFASNLLGATDVQLKSLNVSQFTGFTIALMVSLGIKAHFVFAGKIDESGNFKAGLVKGHDYDLLQRYKPMARAALDKAANTEAPGKGGRGKVKLLEQLGGINGFGRKLVKGEVTYDTRTGTILLKNAGE